MSELIATGWAVQRADGTVVANVEPGATEEGTWWMACGYSHEVAKAKSRGARAFRVEVRKVSP